MQRFRWIALQGSSRGFLPPLLLFFFITTSGIPAFSADVSTACSPLVARVVSIQGSIEILRARQNDWSKVTRLDTPLCEGDRLRTGPLSRAALFIQPETLVRVDQNTNISVSQTAEETLVEFRQEDVLPAAASAYSCGAGYFITRFPRKFRVKTPHLNAAVEGTEFLVAMRCESTELSVFEGKVLAAGTGANIFPAQSVSSGQMLTVGGSEPPTVKLLVKPTDAVQWVLYYPPLSDATAEADLPPAEQCRTLPKPLDQTCLTQRAEALLRLGRVDEAQREVDEAVALDPGRGDANALRAIISIARNDKAGAMEAATAATTASPNSSRAWLALSYAQQASFKLQESLSSARKAQALEPNSSVTNARIAELLMSLGRIKDAEVAARAAVDANPAESRAHTVLGFVHLAQIKTKAARADFLNAIERDSSDPLPRLGLGLAIIRTGKLAEGREQLEIAVALDPTNSLIRSYVGKAYYEENTKERDQLASTQFGLAKELDSKDPTPWFYDAILSQTQNRPIEALHTLQKSIQLNDSRAVYRSRLLLDEDQAVRSSSIARVFQNLGFTRRGLFEAYSSLQGDPSSYPAHQFLADIYSTQRRHEIARVSELLQAQLRQPIYSPPVEPELADDRLGASRLSVVQGVPTGGAGEYSDLFARGGLGLHVDALAGSRETYADELVVSALYDRIAFNVGRFHYQSEGFEFNSIAEKEVYNAFFQVQLGASTSIQAEVRSSDSERGDTRFAFDPDLVIPLRIDEQTENYRIGAHHSFTPNAEVLISTAYQRKDFTNPLLGSDPFFAFISEWSVSEAQFVWTDEKFNLVAGFGQFEGEDRLDDGSFTREVTHDLVYVYANAGRRSRGGVITLGASSDDLESVNLIRRQTNPKIGLVLYPLESTAIRAAWFTSIKRQIIANQTIEPTTVAGFNQFFDDPTGSKVETAGLGLDQQFGSSVFVGVETTSRQLDVPSVTATGFDDLPWKERNYRAYLYWALAPLGLLPRSWSVGLTAEFQREELERNAEITGLEGITTLDTSYVPLAVSAHHTSGVSFRLSVSKVSQKGELRATPDDAAFPRDENFWIADVDIGYRLPKRTGFISVGVRNLFDESSNFVETDPVVRRFAPERFVFGRLSLSF